MMFRRMMTILAVIIILTIFILYFLNYNEFLPTRESKLISIISFLKGWNYNTLHHSYWNDWLQHTDGYELWVAQGVEGNLSGIGSIDQQKVEYNEISAFLEIQQKAINVLTDLGIDPSISSWSILRAC